MNKFLKGITSNRYIYLLIVLSMVLVTSIVRYGLKTYKVPEGDEQHYMRMATEFYRLIKYHLSFNTPYDMLQVVPFRQPGYPLLIVPFLFIFGLSNSYFWGIFVNGLLYIATIFGIYFVAKNFLSSLSSFLGALIFAFYGWTLLHVHLTYSETAVSAFSIWSLFFLIKSDYFQNKKFSIFFGLFLGLGLLVKWVTGIYILGALLYVFYQVIRKRLFKNKKTLINICLAFIIMAIISFYPYYENYYWIFQYFYGHRAGGPMWQIVSEQERNSLSVYSLTYYLNSFAQLGIFYFILIIFGLSLSLKKTSNLKPILLTVIISYFFSVFALLKGERYIIPIYPYLAILSASVFDFIRGNIKNSFVVLTIILSITSFLGSVWGKGPMKESLYSPSIELPFGQLKKIYLTTFSRPPYIYKISGKEIIDFITEDSKKSGIENPQILSLFYYRPLDEPLMTYNLYNQEKPFQISNLIGTVIADSDKNANYLIEVIKNADYILIKSDRRIDNNFSEINYKTLKIMISLFDQNPNILSFYEKKAKFWIYQDSSTVTLFRRIGRMKSSELEEIKLKLVEVLKLN